MSAPLIELRNLCFAYRNRAPLVSDLNTGFDSGSVTVICGTSGAGKSTLLRLICRLEEPVSGQVILDRRPVTEIAAPRLRRRICYVQQIPSLVEGSVEENLRLPLAFKVNQGRHFPNTDELRRYLGDFHLDHVKCDQPALSLSVGEKQRICLLRAILIAPRILLLDEPTAALDDRSSRIVLGIIENLNVHRGITVIMVAHRHIDCWQKVKPRVLHLEQGGLGEQ